jgi:hypothetical protein
MGSQSVQEIQNLISYLNEINQCIFVFWDLIITKNKRACKEV